MGASEKIQEKISTASLFVLPSDFEGMPNALMEAMAAGVPVISSDCSPGGARELIENKVDGLIYNVGDETGLYNSLKQIIDNEEYAELMGQNARKKMELHTEEIIFGKWEKLLHKILFSE